VVAPGETDLEAMLAALDVERRGGVFTYVEFDHPTTSQLADAHAVIREPSSTSIVVDVAAARHHGCPVVIELAWLTLTVHSSLDAVGLTAAVSARLAAIGVPCNVLAGYRHDHLLVPVDRVDDAIAALRA
jgi:hypothetical protein